MIGLLGAIGQRLADRWASLLAVPGLLYVATVTAAVVLGQRNALSYRVASSQIATWLSNPTLKSPGDAVLVLAAVLAGSVSAGLAAAAGGRFMETLWTLPGRHPPARWVANWRRARSRRAKARADDPNATPEQVHRAIRAADRICVIEAACPTWIGDRLRACYVRVEQTYGLDLSTTWPRLWLLIPESTRAELAAARSAFSSAARLTAWAILYLALGLWWWPTIAVAAIIGAAALIKAHEATGNLAELIEATVDLHGRDLVNALDGALTADTGRRLSTRMRKSRWDPDSPLAS
jgi:hypothetical protein